MTMLKTTGLGGGFKHFLFSSLLGEDEPDLTNIRKVGSAFSRKIRIQHDYRTGGSVLK